MTTTLICIGGFPNNAKMMEYVVRDFYDLLPIILNIPTDKYYTIEGVVESLHHQFLIKHGEINKENDYFFILHDFGSIYGKMLIEKYFTDVQVNIIFLSVGPNTFLRLCDRDSYLLSYILFMQLIWLIYLVFPTIANILYRLFLHSIFKYMAIHSKFKYCFHNTACQTYLYWHVWKLLSMKRKPLTANVSCIFIRSNKFDRLFDKYNSADVIDYTRRHWFFLD